MSIEAQSCFVTGKKKPEGLFWKVESLFIEKSSNKPIS